MLLFHRPGGVAPAPLSSVRFNELCLEWNFFSVCLEPRRAWPAPRNDTENVAGVDSTAPSPWQRSVCKGIFLGRRTRVTGFLCAGVMVLLVLNPLSYIIFTTPRSRSTCIICNLCWKKLKSANTNKQTVKQEGKKTDLWDSHVCVRRSLSIKKVKIEVEASTRSS